MGRKKIDSLLSGVVSRRKFPAVVYGLAGIMELFNVSKATAFRYRHNIIKDACTQHGKTIIVDTKKALTLFGVKHPENIVIEREKSDRQQVEKK